MTVIKQGSPLTKHEVNKILKLFKGFDVEHAYLVNSKFYTFHCDLLQHSLTKYDISRGEISCLEVYTLDGLVTHLKGLGFILKDLTSELHLSKTPSNIQEGDSWFSWFRGRKWFWKA